MGERPAGGAAPSADALRAKLALDEVDVEGARVLMRADLNVPIVDGRVVDDTRIRATVPTLRLLLDGGARVALVSHRGRPRGEPDPELSMRPVAPALSALLGTDVATADDCVGDAAEAAVGALRPGDVVLLENLRFHAGETAGDPAFAAALVGSADLFVNDAFGVSHRAHASVVGAARIAPRAVAGRLLTLEVETLSRVLTAPDPPFVLLLGGAKVSDKVAVVTHMLDVVDQIVIGGAMANAFLASQGVPVGDSLAPPDAIQQAGQILARADDAGIEVVLPEDLVVAPSIDRASEARCVTRVTAGEMALDIGPRSRERFARAIGQARTVVWNGPMGVFEVPELAAGTLAIAEAVASLHGTGFTIVGGGDTAAAANAAGIGHRVSHVSTGGGAALDLLSGTVLPGVSALTDRADVAAGS